MANLTEQIIKLQSKPGHETVKCLLRDVLKEQLGATDDEIALEDNLKIVCKGRIDALWGRTIFEIKSDLKKEESDAVNQIKKYIQSKEAETREKYVGIATDGQKYIAYCLLNDTLKEINQFALNKNKTSDFIQWLESVILIKSQLEATPEIICKEIGQESPLCRNSLMQIKCLWEQAKNKSDIQLKYDLWKKSVEIVYGKEGADESLFIEHTYLTIISKAIAYIAFFETASIPLGKYLLSGKAFRDSNVFGVVEDDFFSWIVFCNKGNDLIRQIASHIKRFDFSTIEADILKDLYEGLIRQEQRHKMGEYYTPDWLAEKVCKEIIKKPLEQRIIDPACGSGTFLFHSIKHLIKSADKENISSEEMIILICEKIAGIDIHPVAVIFSRITYLLAMLDKIKQERPDNVIIPVYLGDSLQWGRDEVFRELRILVPEDKRTGAKRRQLIFPESICQDSEKFETILRKMIDLAGKYKKISAFEAWTSNQQLDEHEYKKLSETYQDLLELQKENRNHIWGYVARNLTRPIWLSSEKQKADIVIGNPPWLKFNSMNQEMQNRLKKECFSINLWEKKKGRSKFRTSQDISTYFFIRSVDLYMKEKGTVAFVMPYGVMNGEHHSIFRKGAFERSSGRSIHIKFKNAWVFDSQVKHLFKNSSCVLFSVRKDKSEESIPKNNILYFKGKLPKKNSNLKEASKVLSIEKKKWPSNNYIEPSYYFDKFKAGTQLTPRRFIFVKYKKEGKLGGSSRTPLVKGVVSNLDKHPWKDIKPLEAKIESQFLRSVYVGQSIAPFRVISEKMGVIPWDNKEGVINAFEAEQKGYTNLSNYLENIESIWQQYGTQGMDFKRRINFNGTLENQFPISKLMVVYTSSGTYPAATFLEDNQSIIEVSLHWTKVASKNEGLYLEGVLNSDSLRERITEFQPQGQWGERHIHRHLLKPPIPKYNPKEELHKDIVDHVKKIRKVAHNVELDLSSHFIKIRKKIRNEIQNTQTWNQLNQLVEILLKENQSSKKAS